MNVHDVGERGRAADDRIHNAEPRQHDMGTGNVELVGREAALGVRECGQAAAEQTQDSGACQHGMDVCNTPAAG